MDHRRYLVVHSAAVFIIDTHRVPSSPICFPAVDPARKFESPEEMFANLIETATMIARVLNDDEELRTSVNGALRGKGAPPA